MKLHNYLPKKFGYISCGAILLGVTMLFSACLKSNDDNNYKPILSDLMIVNADPNVASAEFAYGGQRTDYKILYSGNTKYFKDLIAGVDLTFFNGSSTASMTSGLVPSGVDTVFSIYLAGKGDSSFVVSDKFITPSASNAAIRFINASKSAGAVDVTFSTSTEKLNSQGFTGAKETTSPVFKEYSAAATDVKVYAAGTQTELAAYNFTPVAGKSYTLYLRGVKDGQDGKQLGIGRVDHKDAL